MAFLTEKTCFFHVPKTGGYWVHEALKATETLTGYAPNVEHPNSMHHSPPICLTQALYEAGAMDKQWWFVVRHPLSQWRSHWQYIHQRRVHQIGDEEDSRRERTFELTGLPCPSIRKYYDSDFNVFMKSILRHCRGWLSNVYFLYLDGFPDKDRHTFHYEELHACMVKFLKEEGEEFDESILSLLPPQNKSVARKPFYERGVAEDVVASEWEAIKMFGFPTTEEIIESYCI